MIKDKKEYSKEEIDKILSQHCEIVSRKEYFKFLELFWKDYLLKREEEWQVYLKNKEEDRDTLDDFKYKDAFLFGEFCGRRDIFFKRWIKAEEQLKDLEEEE